MHSSTVISKGLVSAQGQGPARELTGGRARAVRITIRTKAGLLQGCGSKRYGFIECKAYNALYEGHFVYPVNRAVLAAPQPCTDCPQAPWPEEQSWLKRKTFAALPRKSCRLNRVVTPRGVILIAIRYSLYGSLYRYYAALIVL